MKRFIETYRQVLILGVLLILTSTSFGQVPGVVSLYMHNGLPLNPAIAGSAGYLTGTVSHRAQWSGFEGAPTTNVFSAHTPLKGENFGLGTVASIDKFGVSNASNINLMGSYRLRFRKHNLYFGLSGGVQQGQNNWQDVTTNQSGDELFESASSVYLTPTLGAGLYFTGKHYYASLSAPVFMDVAYDGGQTYTASFNAQTMPVYLNMGYEIPMNRKIAVRPSAMLTKDRFGDMLADINVLLDFRKQLQVGASWRNNRSVIGMLRFQFLDQFSLAYAFDYALSNLGSYSNGSHEISLQFDLKKNVKALNTRFF